MFEKVEKQNIAAGEFMCTKRAKVCLIELDIILVAQGIFFQKEKHVML